VPASGLGFGMLIMPVTILMLMRKDPGPVGTFLRAGAVSEETARRPSAIGIVRLFLVQDAAKRGVLVGLGDGRFYVDVLTYRRRRRRMIAITLMAAAALTAAGLWAVFSD